MEILGSFIHTIISFSLIIGVIVMIHEGGHFLAARLCGVKVTVFSIGFGRELAGFTDKHGTRWKFSLLPLGGYVKMFGDAGAASNADPQALAAMTPEERSVSFHFKPLWRKAIIVAAGPIANFILTIAIFTALIATGSLLVDSTKPIIGEVMVDTPAAKADLHVGDVVLKIDDVDVSRFSDISEAMALNTGKPVVVTLQRGDETLTKTITPVSHSDKDVLNQKFTRQLIGIRPQHVNFEQARTSQSVQLAVQKTYQICRQSLRGMGQMIMGERSARELKGTLGMAKLSGDVTRQGDTWQETAQLILIFMAWISVNLGMVNLFPIPMLDGGHLAFYCIEALRGRPLADKFQEYSLRFGVAMIACLMAFTLFNDLRNMLHTS